ncbi:FAD/NAD(P)-binding protein [Glaciimonas sp. GG7]
MTRILQVGAGPAGVSVFRQTYFRIEKTEAALEYIIVDGGNPGAGLAFGAESNAHILNLPAESMSLDPDNPLEFIEWRAKQQAFWQGRNISEDLAWSTFPPRRLFGNYVASVLQTCLGKAKSAELVRDTVESVTPIGKGEKFSVKFRSGTFELFDRVILCLGHAPNIPILPASTARFYENPYVQLDIPIDASVGIVGTRLSAIDAVLALKEQGHTGRLVMASRSGQLPRIIGRKSVYDPKNFLDALRQKGNQTTLIDLLSALKSEIERLEGGSINWDKLFTQGATTLQNIQEELAIVDANIERSW